MADDPRDALAKALANWSAGSASNPNDPPVYWGQRTITTSRRIPGQQMVDGEFSITRGDDVKTLSQAQAMFYEWTDAERSEWGDYLVEIGMIEESDSSDFNVLKDAWAAVLNESVGFTAAGRDLTPRQVARLMAGAGQTQNGFTGSRTTRQTHVDLTDPATARALVNDVISNALGRAANDDELRTFAATLAAHERSNPTVSTTTTAYQGGEALSSNTMTSGGTTSAGSAETLRQQAMKIPDYGAYQASRMVMDWLGQAISAPV